MALRFYTRNEDGSYTEETIAEMRERIGRLPQGASNMEVWWLTIAGREHHCGSCTAHLDRGTVAAYMHTGQQWRCQGCVENEGLQVRESRKFRQRRG
jgi:hypothetical protein